MSTSFASPSLIDAGEAGVILPVGASVSDAGVLYRVWAPERERVLVRVEGPRSHVVELTPHPDGHHSGVDPAGKAGDCYRFDLGGELLPDPASRFQPRGVEGPSEVIDSRAYAWKTRTWRRPPLRGRVIYELHIGTFTPEGTFAAAIGKLDALVELGVNTLELLPVAACAGTRNWGYDGVFLFAPAQAYGRPDDLRAFVDAAHAHGLAVVLDVVYNHLGAVGNVLPRFSPRYFHADRANVWGRTLNFDRDAGPCRRFFIQNACQWLDEYGVDGLRLDATHAIEDASPRHIIADITEAVRLRGGFTIAEDERNDARLITPVADEGLGLDAVWADDFHHAVRVALTGQREAHFASFTGGVDEWARTLREGWLYRGQHCPHLGKPRGTPAGHRPPEQFVHCISNHDQVGNRPLGERLHDAVPPEAYRALSMLLCLDPGTPMLFMGQEWAAGTPFLFFTDLPGEIGAGMAENRKKEFAHYGANYDEATLARMPDPQSPDTFAASKLDWSERGREPHRGVLALYRACLGLRARHPVFQSPPRSSWAVQKAGENLLGLRWRDPEGDWLLLAGLARGEGRVADQDFVRCREGRRWQAVLASEAPSSEGGAVAAPPSEDGAEAPALRLPGAVLFREI